MFCLACVSPGPLIPDIPSIPRMASGDEMYSRGEGGTLSLSPSSWDGRHIVLMVMAEAQESKWKPRGAYDGNLELTFFCPRTIGQRKSCDQGQGQGVGGILYSIHRAGGEVMARLWMWVGE